MASRDSFTANSSAGQRTPRSKVKSGCRTCKARKLKCDEGRPSCSKCISSGRKCDGYGIWGGGSSLPGASSHAPNGANYSNDVLHHHQHPRPLYHQTSTHSHIAGPIIRQNPFPLVGGKHPTDAEYCYFEWFRSRTIKKLQSTSGCDSLWDTLLMRAVFDEPAVLHAALALGSAHKRESLHGDGSCMPPLPPLREDGGEGYFTRAEVEKLDEEQIFALSQYTKSIHQLQPHFSNTRSRASVRVALIACLVFICLEFLRGRYRTGAEHLRSGMKLLVHLGGGSTAAAATSQRDPVDEWLFDAFATLNLQANLLGQGTIGSQLSGVQRFDPNPFPVMFQSMSEAKRRLDWLIDELIHLQAEASSLQTPQLQSRKHRFLGHLESWSRVYKVSRVSLVVQLGPTGQASYIMLSLYSTMAFIMAATCSHSDGESAFDAYAQDFASIVKRALDIRAMGSPDDEWVDPQTMSAYGNYAFIVDRGWIPPLYFTAVKCRDGRIRAQAIDLLKSSESKEGIWDSSIAALVAEEVVRLEERGSHDGGRSTSQRIRDTQLTLPDHGMEAIVVVCHFERDGDLTRIYDPHSKTWSTGGHSVQQAAHSLEPVSPAE